MIVERDSEPLEEPIEHEPKFAGQPDVILDIRMACARIEDPDPHSLMVGEGPHLYNPQVYTEGNPPLSL